MINPKRYWSGRQWMVTNFGLETIQMRGAYSYFIKKTELHTIDDHFIRYLKEKGWIDIDDFKAGLRNAIEIHGGYLKTKRDRKIARTLRKPSARSV
jgi:hypothetical protein